MTAPAVGLRERLLAYANDPMWAEHAEVPKALLREAAAALLDGWVMVPKIGAEVKADHPITCLNPTETFEVVAVEVDSLGARARGEATCWFGVSLLSAALAPGDER